MQLRTVTELTESEEQTALMPLVRGPANTDNVVHETIADFAESLHAENPIEVAWKEDTLWEDYQTPIQIGSSTIYSLNFKSGNAGTRHNFSDGYVFFRFHLNSNTPVHEDSFNSYLIPASKILNSSETEPANINGTPTYSTNFGAFLSSGNFAKITNTSFKVPRGLSGSENNYLAKIVGLRQIIRPSSIS